ncbi:MAG: DUF3857 domain-containing protein [Chitinophagaceae bacterium]|nr:DUF3857 domain-containing protein [Chitinophagaceae bacterium]
MRIVLFCVQLMLVTAVAAQDYNIGNIPDSLKRNSNAVKRLEELRVTIKALDKVVIKHRYAITILNENGDEFAEYSNSYSSLEGLSDISGNLYDAAGKKIKSVKRKDIQDESSSDGYSLMLDDRIKRHNFHNRQYPYTVEYEDEQQVKGSYFLPAWHPVADEEFSVEQSRYIVETPAGYKLRYKALNFPAKPAVQETAQLTTYTWELKNYTGLQSERFQPAMNTLVPSVYIGPDDFMLGNYKGNMSTWQGFGKFQAELNKGRDQLPDNIRQEVHKLTDGVSDRAEKIRLLYEFLQRNTRYVSVQLGVGGWQPFDAKYVIANKYGDCKALSNYMVSLLKEAGIKANYVIVNAGRGSRNPREDFPAPYFNHVIACVPGDRDTTWLECTSQTESAGFMGTFTGDRKALLIDDDGGHLVSTPRYLAGQNTQVRRIKAVVDGEGNLSVDVNTRFTGTQQEEADRLIHHKTQEEREKYLNSSLGLATYKVDKFDYKQVKGALPVIDEYLHISAPNYATISGRRLFLTPNLFTRSTLRLAADSGRKYPIEFLDAFTHVDSIFIDIPAGYITESMPKNVAVTTEFGQYRIDYKFAGNQIEVVRTRIMNRSSFPAAYYPELVKYFDMLYKADNSRIVLVKKEG